MLYPRGTPHGHELTLNLRSTLPLLLTHKQHLYHQLTPIPHFVTVDQLKACRAAPHRTTTHPTHLAPVPTRTDHYLPHSDFDSTLGYPGEGPSTQKRRRILGGRCTNWKVSAQPDRAQPAACANCSTPFEPREPRLCTSTAGEGCQTQRKYVHLHCLAGGWQPHFTLDALEQSDGAALVTVQRTLQQMHSLPAPDVWPADHSIPLAPTTEQAQDTNTQQPELPYDDTPATDPASMPPSQAARPDSSTHPHPPQPLRPLLPAGIALDDMAWYRDLAWDDISKLAGRTFVQVPARLQHKISAIQHQLVATILRHGPEAPESLPHWKALLLSSWTFLTRPHNLADTSRNAAQVIEDRLTLWELGLYESLHQQTHADSIPTHKRGRKQDAEKRRLQAKAARITTLTSNREVSRALSSLTAAAHPVVDLPAARTIQQLYPNTTRHPAYPPPRHIDPTVITQIQDEVSRALRRLGRLTEPGPLGIRPEHLLGLLSEPDHAEKL